MCQRKQSATCVVAVATLAACAGLSIHLAAARGQGTPQGTTAQATVQKPPVFGSGTVAVPIDVRVIDGSGRPVSDLQQDDFTLLEDGVPQPIRHFERHDLAAGPAPSAGTRPPSRESPFGIAPQNNRVFLIVLGRGRLQEPSRALDALQRFVREQLLPQDHVAVFAYNRATDFTTDHELVAGFIERFKRSHLQIDMEVGLAIESSMAAIYGSRALPKSLQQKIDSMFVGAGALAYRQVGEKETASTKRAAQDLAKAADQLQRQEDQKLRQELADMAARDLGVGTVGTPPPGSWSSMDEVSSQTFTRLGLNDFMANTAQSLQDLGNCYAAIEYLRHLEGEKHLVFVTERGINLPRLEDDMDLTRAANDARVVIDTFQTGGLEGQQGGAWTDQSRQTFAFKALRVIAEQTGGVSSVSEKGMVAVSRINDVSRVTYLLGYYPSSARLDGSYRKIQVKVRRPGVTVLYRRGYYARPEIGSFDRRSFITKDRLMAVAGFRRVIDDIKVKLDASIQKTPTGHEVVAKGTINTSRLFFDLAEGRHVGSLDLLVVCFNDKDEVIGQNYQRANVDLTEDAFKAATQSGLPYDVRFEMSPAVRRVRLVVYDYRADLAGSADRRVF